MRPYLGARRVQPGLSPWRTKIWIIQAATKEAAAKGWETTVIDAQGSADQANAAIQNLVARKAGAILDMVFPVSSLGAGLHAAQEASIPVAT